jgi:hypothetical protein
MQDEELKMPQRTEIFNLLCQADMVRVNVGSISLRAFDSQYRQSYQEGTEEGVTTLAKDWQRVFQTRRTALDRATEARLKRDIEKLKESRKADGVDDDDEDEDEVEDEESKGDDEDEVEEQVEQEFEAATEQDVEEEDDDMHDADDSGEDMEVVEDNAVEESDELPDKLHYDSAENVGRWSWNTVEDSDRVFDLEVPGASFCDPPTVLRRIRVQLERAGIADIWTQGINIYATSVREKISASGISNRPQEGSVQETLCAQRTVLVEHVLNNIYHGDRLSIDDWHALGCVETDGVLHPPGYPPSGAR